MQNDLALRQTPTPSLVTLEEVCALLAQVYRVDEVKAIIDKAEAARVYARQARLGLQAQNHAAEIRVRAEIRGGELLKEIIPHSGGNPQLSRPATVGGELPPRLVDFGVTRSQSSRWQAAASIPPAVVEEYLAQRRARGEEITTHGLLKLAPRPAYEPPLQPDIIHSALSPHDRFTSTDALDLGEHWEPGQVNLWVTSPPYALDIPYKGGDVPSYGEWLTCMRDWLSVMHALTEPKHGRLCLNVPLDRDLGGWEPVSADVIHVARQAGWSFRTWLIWDKDQAGAGTDRGSVDSASAPNITAPVESVLVLYRGQWRRPGPKTMPHDDWLSLTGPRGLWKIHTVRGNSLVPAPFPEELARRCIITCSFPDDVVADPFCGFGTSGAVAARLGRIAWMADRNPACVDHARGWVARERAAVAA